MLCQSLLYSKVIQLYTYIHSFPLWFIPGDWISILHTPAKISSFANTAFHVLFLSSKHFINSIYRTKSKLLGGCELPHAFSTLLLVFLNEGALGAGLCTRHQWYQHGLKTCSLAGARSVQHIQGHIQGKQS